MSRKKIHAPVKYGRLNIAGLNIKKFRCQKIPTLSQNGLAALVQLEGIPMTKNTVQRIEAGAGAVNDIQLKVFAKVLSVSIEELLDESLYQNNPEIYDNKKDAQNLAVAIKKSSYK
ncbi:MAG: helix-turn-helix transcriptional regulator [Treponema sp.]|nr:helix-turn-helix transcriptional regulator [Treponema sp.]